MQLLVVDDSEELLELLERGLRRDGHEVLTATSLSSARLALSMEQPEVLILDLALPDGQGIDLCEELRARENRIPILLLTAHGEVKMRVAGLDAGADDFLAKPFAIAELRARVRALGRRGPLARSARMQLGAVELNLGAREARVGEQEIPITAREWAILEMLISRQGRVVEREALLLTLWEEVSEKTSASLDVLIGRIRNKLGETAIRTLRGQGYALGS